MNVGSLTTGFRSPKTIHIFQMVGVVMTVVLTAYEKFWAVRAVLAELQPVSNHAPECCWGSRLRKPLLSTVVVICGSKTAAHVRPSTSRTYS
jgi:hypothetical protein